MTTDRPSGKQSGQDYTLRPYSAPHIVRLDIRETAAGTGSGSDGLVGS